MADQLATLQDLTDAMGGIPLAEVPTGTGTLYLEVATAVVQEAAGLQRIVQVVGDTAEILGTTESWLDLPQVPVTAVASVTLDGTALTEGIEASQYKRFGSRLFREDGWQTFVSRPGEVVVVNTHGYPAGVQELQLARGTVIGLAKWAITNLSGVASESIDDYSVTYERMSTRMEASTNLKASLRRQYGRRRAGLARIG